MMSNLAESAHEILILDDFGSNEQDAITHHWPQGCSILVVDHYQKDISFETGMRIWADRILVLDDLANRLHDCDFLLDQTLGRNKSDYMSLVPDHCTLLLGSHYALLRSQFFNMRKHALSSRSERTSINRILVSMGASDPQNVTNKVLQGIALWNPNISIDVVIGPGGPPLQADNKAGNIRILKNVDDMATLMAKADLAIGAAGTSSWERCCLGLPSLLIITADNQKMVAHQLEQAGAAIIVGFHDMVSAIDISNAIQNLTVSVSDFQHMSQCAASVCDGLGHHHVLLSILPQVIAADGKAVSLKLAMLADTDLMYRWQSNPNLRKHSRQPLSPTYDEHVSWVEASLSNPRRMILLIMHAGISVGILRFDKLNEANKYEISILIDDKYQGLGIASAALSLGRALHPSSQIIAEVHIENKASRTLFLNAGYVPIDETHYLSEPM
ncbi:UDP-2,4-diacetamido-2,4,6-trideoxy-beta-L-altropyranose hydrolase [Magnetovibrio blakemorei]|uniref:UDP-2,4-diacetamido-2,4, 6-trideoxy-beta-L-altropyranose hydrolase n=2 Tax=Magnetovibrio blakemorei TaxID=28181 RepID=A0A1E5Q6C7_9PROT|nr:UDP-2,4-diacetamido-2,4,6-trideoxy-beta-L-altropyranose hydrolase [Magnetovibrio blakemorei]